MDLKQFRNLRVGSRVTSVVNPAVFKVVAKSKDRLVLHHFIQIPVTELDNWCTFNGDTVAMRNLIVRNQLTNEETLRLYIITDVLEDGCLAVASAVLTPNVLHAWNTIPRNGK